jgi:hypothetical protein
VNAKDRVGTSQVKKQLGNAKSKGTQSSFGEGATAKQKGAHSHGEGATAKAKGCMGC